MGTEFVSCLFFSFFLSVVSGILSHGPGIMAVAMETVVHQTNIRTARTGTPACNGPSQKHSHNKNTGNVVVNTCYMPVAISLRCSSAVYPSVFRVWKDCNACHDLWNNTLFCLAEQNIWLYFLAYRQIINNSHLILPQLLPSLPLFFIIPLSALSALLLPFSPIWYHTYAVVSMIYGRARCPAPVIYAAAHQLVHSRGLRPLLQPKGGLLDSHGYAYWVTLWDKHCCTGSHPPLTMLYE